MKYLKPAILGGALLITFAAGYYQGAHTPQPYTEADTAVIKAYILHEVSLTDEQTKHLDIDKDGRISSRDYALVKNRVKKMLLSLGGQSI